MTQNTSAQPKLDSIEFTATVTTPEDVKVPISVSVEFPKGYGLYAVKTLEQIQGHTEALYADLVNRQDASTIAVLLQGEGGDSE